ncbi:MFS transporter family protein [[Mycoplasma] cavipharyngis]|uniref:hypothetical protein n=1 Tax=[Mycoplasma] cavipharyngis TaxID=92757 RepID=UPI0037040C63
MNQPFKIQQVHESKVNQNTFSVDQKKIYEKLQNVLEETFKSVNYSPFWTKWYGYLVSGISFSIAVLFIILFIVLNINYKYAFLIVAAIFTLSGLIIFSCIKSKRKKLSRILTEQIDVPKMLEMVAHNLDPNLKLISAADERLVDYDDFFKVTRIITWTEKEKDRKVDYSAIVTREIDLYSKLYVFDLNGVEIAVQAIMWSEDVDTDAKKARKQLVVNQVLGCIQSRFKNDDVFQDLNFVLNYRPNFYNHVCLNKSYGAIAVQTENSQFNSVFSPESDHWQRFLQMFTPLAMQRYLETNKLINCPYTVNKVKDMVHICFNLRGSFMIYWTKFGFNIDIKKVAENIASNMINDFYLTYTLINHILLLPLY